ncbi:MAG: methyl-accepting chemotaxis protein [Alphaproteobacteria bacterium]
MRISTFTKYAYAVTVGLSVATGLCLWLASESLDEEREAARRQVEFKQLGFQLAQASDYLTNEVRRYSVSGAKIHHENYWQEVKENRTRDHVVDRLRTLNAPQAELDLIEKAKRESDALIKLEEQAMAAVEKGDLERARSFVFGADYDRNKAAIGESIGQFQSMMAKRALREVAAAESRAALLYAVAEIMVALSAATFLAILFFGFARRVIEPIRRMRTVVRGLAEQDYSVAVPDLDRSDEIGEMAKSVQVFKENGIERKRLGAERAAEREARENRAQQMEALTRSFEAKVGSLVQALSASATQMRATAESMTATAEQTNTRSVAVAEASDEATANVQTVATAADELSASVSEIGRQVEQSAEIAGRAVEDAKHTDATVQALADSAQKIGEVVVLIQDIASQTNLLALNATIEAARAGEAGKGFAVVASEVKSLANQTAKATEEIGTQIAQIQDATKLAVDAIRNIGATIGEISQIAATIASAVEEQGAATQEIARNVQEAARGTEDVSNNISGVKEAAAESGSAASQVLSSAGDLAQHANQLTDHVNEFLSAVKAA